MVRTLSPTGAERSHIEYLSPSEEKLMANKKDAQPVHPFVILKVNGSETNELNRYYLCEG